MSDKPESMQDVVAKSRALSPVKLPTTPNAASLLTRYDALPARQKQLFGKLCIAHAVNVDMLRQSMPGLPPDPIVQIMESLMVSVEPK